MKKIGELEMKRTLENVQETVNYSFFFHIVRVHLDITKIILSTTNAKVS